MASHSSTLAWKIPWMPSRLQSMGSLRVWHDWATSFHFSLSCIGEGNGNPLQCSCLENPMDRGIWWATVHGVAKSWTWLKRLGIGHCRMSTGWVFLPNLGSGSLLVMIRGAFGKAPFYTKWKVMLLKSWMDFLEDVRSGIWKCVFAAFFEFFCLNTRILSKYHFLK